MECNLRYLHARGERFTMDTNTNVLHSLPVLPLKNTVLFPYLFVPLSAGRPGSVAAVEAALASEDKGIVLLTQRDGYLKSNRNLTTCLLLARVASSRRSIVPNKAWVF